MKKIASLLGAAMLFAGQAWGDASIESQFGPGATATKAPNALAGESAADYFGTDRNFSSLNSYAMNPFEPGFQGVRSSTTGLFCNTTSTSSKAVGQVQVPHGVRLDLLRVWLFDSSVAEDMTVSLQSACLPDFAAALPTLTPLLSISSAGSGGAYSNSNFLPNTTADNQSCDYLITVQFGPNAGSCTSTSLGYYKSRVQWFRQTPPGPAVASFTDVPTTYLFFNQIEAMARAGITSGCTATQFCPDATLTRGQMAAFLARALGIPLGEGIVDPANP